MLPEEGLKGEEVSFATIGTVLNYCTTGCVVEEFCGMQGFAVLWSQQLNTEGMCNVMHRLLLCYSSLYSATVV